MYAYLHYTHIHSVVRSKEKVYVCMRIDSNLVSWGPGKTHHRHHMALESHQLLERYRIVDRLKQHTHIHRHRVLQRPYIYILQYMYTYTYIYIHTTFIAEAAAQYCAPLEYLRHLQFLRMASLQGFSLFISTLYRRIRSLKDTNAYRKICIYVYKYSSTYLCICIYMCLYACLYERLYVCMHIKAYVYFNEWRSDRVLVRLGFNKLISWL